MGSIEVILSLLQREGPTSEGTPAPAEAKRGREERKSPATRRCFLSSRTKEKRGGKGAKVLHPSRKRKTAALKTVLFIEGWGEGIFDVANRGSTDRPKRGRPEGGGCA